VDSHRRRTIHLGIIFLVAAGGSSQEKEKPLSVFDAQAARGTVVNKLACLDNPAQSYSLYLPSNYSPDRRWPMLYAFDPFARGKTAVEVYQAVAKEFARFADRS